MKKAKEVERITFDNDDPVDVLSKLELTDGDTLLNAGAALFVNSGMNDLQMAKFATNEKVTFTDIRRHTGSIIGLVEIAMQYLIDAMDWRAEFHGKLERKEIPEIPVDALREAVVNAFAHQLWKAFHNLCYAKLSVMQSQLQLSSILRKAGAFYFA